MESESADDVDNDYDDSLQDTINVNTDLVVPRWAEEEGLTARPTVGIDDDFPNPPLIIPRRDSRKRAISVASTITASSQAGKKPKALPVSVDSQSEASTTSTSTKSTKAKASWGLGLTRDFMKELLYFHRAGRLRDNRLGARNSGMLYDVFESIAQQLTKNPRAKGQIFTAKHIKVKHETEKKRWKAASYILDKSGSSFDEETGLIQSSEDNWASLSAIFSGQFDALRTKPFCLPGRENLDVYQEIFATERASGSYIRPVDECIQSSVEPSGNSTQGDDEVIQTPAHRSKSQSNTHTTRRRARGSLRIEISDDEDDDDIPASIQAQRTSGSSSRKIVSLAQATLAMGTSIEKAANMLVKDDQVILIREAIRDFQTLYREKMSKAARIRVIQQLGEGNNASFWLEMDEDLKDDFAEVLSQRPLP
jgi:hypothetical protein